MVVRFKVPSAPSLANPRVVVIVSNYAVSSPPAAPAPGNVAAEQTGGWQVVARLARPQPQWGGPGPGMRRGSRIEDTSHRTEDGCSLVPPPAIARHRPPNELFIHVSVHNVLCWGKYHHHHSPSPPPHPLSTLQYWHILLALLNPPAARFCSVSRRLKRKVENEAERETRTGWVTLVLCGYKWAPGKITRGEKIHLIPDDVLNFNLCLVKCTKSDLITGVSSDTGDNHKTIKQDKEQTFLSVV